MENGDSPTDPWDDKILMTLEETSIMQLTSKIGIFQRFPRKPVPVDREVTGRVQEEVGVKLVEVDNQSEADILLLFHQEATFLQ